MHISGSDPPFLREFDPMQIGFTSGSDLHGIESSIFDPGI